MATPLNKGAALRKQGDPYGRGIQSDFVKRIGTRSAPPGDSIDAMLPDEFAECIADPFRHVMVSYPWGREGTVLAQRDGPEQWQYDLLQRIGEAVRERAFNGRDPVAPVHASVASGHGVGKSAMSAWLIRWLMDTRPDCRGVVSANTREQLRTKTWAELAKWHGLSASRHWYTLNAGGGSLALYHNSNPPNWRVDAQTCEANNSEAFAGQHQADSSSWYLFDEASAIPNIIYEVRDGGTTDGEPFLFDFGNPTRTDGRFYENMVGRHKTDDIIRVFVDSRDVRHTNKGLFEKWAKTYGEDSDFFKIRVKGEFPLVGENQFIPRPLVERCAAYEYAPQPNDPVIIGVDVARFGDDRSVIYTRRGREARMHPIIQFSGMDTMQLAARIAEKARELKPDVIFIDGGGVGGGVVDRCRQLGIDVIEVNFGEAATDPDYANMRAQCWGNLRALMREGLAISGDPELQRELATVHYTFNRKNAIVLEAKDDMKKRGEASPDIADALALTCAYHVGPRQGYEEGASPSQQMDEDYNPFR